MKARTKRKMLCTLDKASCDQEDRDECAERETCENCIWLKKIKQGKKRHDSRKTA